jgi:hypothetical protein
VVVEVVGGRVAGAEFVACDRIRFVSVDVDVTTLSSVDAVRDTLAKAAADELASAEGRSIIIRARLVGRSDVHGALRADHALPELLLTLRDDFAQVAPWCWWAHLDDSTAALIDVEALRGGSDFAADLIAVAEELSVACSGSSLALGLEAELPSALFDDITATLPKALRMRATMANPSARDLLSTGLLRALDELGAGESFAEAGR